MPLLGSGRPVQAPGLPLRFLKEVAPDSVDAPLLGQHTESVLSQLGLSQEELAELASEGIIHIGEQKA